MKLELDGLTKEFGDFTAVNHINLTMLNKDIIDFLKRYDIPIGISIRGGWLDSSHRLL